MSDRNFRVISLNVNGLVNPVKRSKIIAKVKRAKVQVVYFQETHLSQLENEKLKSFGYRNTFYSTFKGGRKRGVSILIPNSINFELTKEIKDKEGRYIMVIGKLENREVTLFNIYAPPGSNTSFFKSVFDLISTHAKGVLICAGDWNTVLHKSDTTNTKHKMGAQTRVINKSFDELGLFDVWREFHPAERDFTHYSAPHLIYSRIDYFLMFRGDRHRIGECSIETADLSDHSAIYLSLHLNSRPRNTIWRLNKGILNNKTTIEQIKKEINQYIEHNDNGEVSPAMLWDAAKAVLRGNMIAITTARKKQKEQQLNHLDQKLRTLEHQHKATQDRSILEQIRVTRKAINSTYEDEVEKKHIFTRQSYYETGPRATKLLARRLRKQQALNTINKIKDPQTGDTVTNLADIEKAFEKYYTTLYTQPTGFNKETTMSFLDSLDLPSIGTKQNDSLTAVITEDELKKAISRLKANKCPGSDGLPAEWYKCFGNEIIPLLLPSFNYTLEEGIIPPSWKEAIITVIPKEGKDHQLCGSYRPISILNIDYKLYASIITKRLETFLPDLIDTDQTGFVTGRQTQDNIRRTLHILNHIKKERISSTLLSLDAEKAFDCVGWGYLFQVLERFGFNDKSIKCIGALYSGPTARIKVNGHLSQTVLLNRGTRQGCPASPALFALYIEPLAEAIRENSGIKGIMINEMEHKIALYADDVLIYLRDPNIGLPVLMDSLEMYGQYSGYKLNVQKTQILSYNYNPSLTIKNEYGFKWNLTSIKYLGIQLTKDLSQLFDKNYKFINTKIKDDIDRWNLAQMDLSSRIEAVKMNIVPRLLYLFQSLPVDIPLKQFNEWNKWISRFIWKGKKPRVRYPTLQLPRDKGGMSLPSLKEYYIAAQLRPLVCWCDMEYTAKWKTIEISQSDVPIQTLLGDRKRAGNLADSLDPVTLFTLQIWFKTVKRLGLGKEARVLRWIAFDPDFVPAFIDHRFKQWTMNGITAFCCIMENGVMMSFQTMKEKFGLENHDLFRYLQLRHYLSKEIISERIPADGMVQLITRAYVNGTNKIVSGLYRRLMSARAVSTEYIKVKWEKELGIAITKEDWENICDIHASSTSSRTWREFCWKCIVRFFITPKIKAKQLGRPQQCWRQCGSAEADHSHIFWHCPCIKNYWVEVHSTIKDILGFDIPQDASFLYLGNLPQEFLGEDRYLTKILLAASKKAVTRLWCRQDPPTKAKWLDIVKEIYIMERLTFILRLQLDTFVDLWEKWHIFSSRG